VVVPISANTVGVADPNDTSRIFSVLGVATGPAATSATVLDWSRGVRGHGRWHHADARL
jgi:hypothetical protein